MAGARENRRCPTHPMLQCGSCKYQEKYRGSGNCACLPRQFMLRCNSVDDRRPGVVKQASASDGRSSLQSIEAYAHSIIAREIQEHIENWHSNLPSSPKARGVAIE